MRRALRLWSCFWGEKHLDLFEKALVQSLSWPINRQALAGAKWDIWTLEKEFPYVADIAKKVSIDIELNAADSFLERLPTEYLNDSGVMINQMLIKSIRRCIDTESQMLIAPPDTIFGGDSIPNILQAGEDPGSVVFVAHMRVVPSILGEIDERGKSNWVLCDTALRFAHRSWVEAEAGKERSNSFVGGIYWQRRPNGVIAVRHRLPTPYLINWQSKDYDWFARPTPQGEWPAVMGEIDHAWPGAWLFQEERARVIGSSDDAFICEVTDPESNVPPLMNYSKDEPDKFWRGAFHNKINRAFQITFRGVQS